VTNWLLPALGFVLATGLVGVTSKLALRSVDWPELVLWTTGAYLIASAALLLSGAVRFQWNRAVGMLLVVIGVIMLSR
jgi:uncharacterized membrane protein YfcA